MRRIGLVSKLATSNLGNDALSAELIRAIQGYLPADITLEVMDRPYELSIPADFIRRTDIARLVETLAHRHALLARGFGFRPAPRTTSFPRVVGGTNLGGTDAPSKVAAWRSIRRAVAAPFRSAWRAGALHGLSAYVFAGAGAVRDQSSCIEHLIEMRAAQILGIKTAAVCQSINVHIPALQLALAAVYKQCDFIVVRGEESKRRLSQFGVGEARISIAADPVWLAGVQGQRREREIALLNPTMPTLAAGADAWRRLADRLTKDGYRVVLGTSDALADREALRVVHAELGGRSEIRSYSSHRAFMRDMSAASVVVAGRMHACVMALKAGVPIVWPIFGEGDIRMTEVFTGGPVTPLYSAHGWDERVALQPQTGVEEFCADKEESAMKNAIAIAEMLD